MLLAIYVLGAVLALWQVFRALSLLLTIDRETFVSTKWIADEDAGKHCDKSETYALREARMDIAAARERAS